ncbi:MAG: hypothetical protein GY714_30500 [Desulfobacterales bacterium]|nr:hypothetical protein [Desulfobacterales bacterium]MCP4161060.1 hypothetical protein [Deltaproteobacteria bacterium]
MKIKQIILITILIILGLSFNVKAQEESFEPVLVGIENIYYHAGKLKYFDKKTAAVTNEILSSNSWKPLVKFNKKELTSKNEIWIKVLLPREKYLNRAISIRSFLNSYEVYLNDKIGEHSIEVEESDFRYYNNHIISIPERAIENVLTLRIFYNIPANFGKIYNIMVGEKEDLYQDIIDEQNVFFKDIINEMFLGFVLIVFGVVSLFIFLMRFKNKDYPFLTFGFFAFLAGVRYLCGIRLLFFFNISPITFLLIENLSFLLIPVTLFAFVEQIFTSNRNRIIRVIWQSHLLIALIAFFLIINNINYEPYVITILFISSIVCFYVIYKSKKDVSLNIRTPFLAFLTMLIGLIINQISESFFQFSPINIIVQNIFNRNIDIFGWGILGLTFALCYILIKHYTILIKNMQKVSIELVKNRSEILKLSQAKLESQFDALKNQLNPHFLFNNFSTLISIIEENSTKAVDFVQELANVYRYILKTRIQEHVYLSTEVEFVYSYEFLMKQRFGDNIKLNVNVSEEYLTLKIPPFSLQLLIENAIKHNVISIKKPLTIDIFVEYEYIIVKNNLQKKNVIERSTNIGLSNIVERYKYFTKREVFIVPDEKNFTVKLPLLKRKEWLNNEISNN